MRHGEAIWKDLMGEKRANARTAATYSALGWAYDLLGQACLSLDAGAHASASLQCRTALEAAAYILYTHRIAAGAADTWRIDIPRGERGGPRKVPWGTLLGDLRDRSFLSGDALGQVKRIRKHGNLIAHLPEVIWRGIVLATPGSMSGVRLWVS